MDYAKFKETALPVGASHLRVNHLEVTAHYGEAPVMVVAIEKRTTFSDGTTFGTQLDSITIPLEGQAGEFDILDRKTGEKKKSALTLDEFSDMLFSLQRYALVAQDAVIAAKSAAATAQAEADKLKNNPFEILD